MTAAIDLIAGTTDKPGKYNWFIKYKIYHLPFWFAYHCMWWVVTVGSFSAVANNILFSAYSIKFLFYVVFQALAVYFNLYFLMPRFLEKGRYIAYIVLTVLTTVIAAIFIDAGYYFSAWVSRIPFESLYGIDPFRYTFFFQVNTLPSTAAAMTLGMSVKLTKNWIQTKRREQVLEKEKLETELKFLRSQLNPHFLFNSINSIFVLIHKNPDMASESLAKFSDLLRYQLYECNEHHIPVDKELTYVENYIELEKLRQEHHIELVMELDKRYDGNLTISPFILIPFIENAFKHVSKRKDKKNWIRMNLRISNYELLFEISNSIDAGQHASTEFMNYGGIGLTNVKRRLDLVYPNRYTLDIQKDDQQFAIRLQLKLEEYKPVKPEQAIMKLSVV